MLPKRKGGSFPFFKHRLGKYHFSTFTHNCPHHNSDSNPPQGRGLNWKQSLLLFFLSWIWDDRKVCNWAQLPNSWQPPLPSPCFWGTLDGTFHASIIKQECNLISISIRYSEFSCSYTYILRKMWPLKICRLSFKLPQFICCIVYCGKKKPLTYIPDTLHVASLPTKPSCRNPRWICAQRPSHRLFMYVNREAADIHHDSVAPFHVLLS